MDVQAIEFSVHCLHMIKVPNLLGVTDCCVNTKHTVLWCGQKIIHFYSYSYVVRVNMGYM